MEHFVVVDCLFEGSFSARDGKKSQHIARMRHSASQLYTPVLDLIARYKRPSRSSLPSFSLPVTDTCPDFSLHMQHIKRKHTFFFFKYILNNKNTHTYI